MNDTIRRKSATSSSVSWRPSVIPEPAPLSRKMSAIAATRLRWRTSAWRERVTMSRRGRHPSTSSADDVGDTHALLWRTRTPGSPARQYTRPSLLTSMSILGAILTCRRCSCGAVYSGSLEVSGIGECSECHHPLIGDHILTRDGVADPAKQFRRAPATLSVPSIGFSDVLPILRKSCAEVRFGRVIWGWIELGAKVARSRKPSVPRGFGWISLVAGAGFEPATFGL